jgi:hypothetical protein
MFICVMVCFVYLFVSIVLYGLQGRINVCVFKIKKITFIFILIYIGLK